MFKLTAGLVKSSKDMNRLYLPVWCLLSCGCCLLRVALWDRMRLAIPLRDVGKHSCKVPTLRVRMTDTISMASMVVQSTRSAQRSPNALRESGQLTCRGANQVVAIHAMLCTVLGVDQLAEIKIGNSVHAATLGYNRSSCNDTRRPLHAS